MAAKGTQLKEDIFSKLAELYPVIRQDKEFRICGSENGEAIEIKVQLTCAKTNIGNGNSNIIDFTTNVNAPTPTPAPDNFMQEPTEEEKKTVSELLEKLGLENK